ncbi:MAG: hypothetical protein AAB448_04920 [Patescibacteria group bacterium]
MPESKACLNARTSLEEIRSLKQEFYTAYSLAVSSGREDDIKKAQELKHSLEMKIKALQETLAIVEAERLYDLRRQYEAQVVLLSRSGLIQRKEKTDPSSLEEEPFSMTGIDGKTYPIPSYETIVSRLAEQRELLRTKADQDFNRLLLVPFGMSLDAMLAKFKAYLLEYKKAYDKAHEKDTPPGVFALEEKEPVWVWNQYNGADVNGSLVYDPLIFDTENHGGKTKIDILSEQNINQDTTAGWRVLLLQGGRSKWRMSTSRGDVSTKGFKSIPRPGKGESEGTNIPRKDIEAGESPKKYLANLQVTSRDQDSPYYGESGMCPEEWIVMFMAHLEETGKPIDDWGNNTDSIAYLTGAYPIISDDVPSACWDREDRRQARVYLNDIGDAAEYMGVRFTVRV